MTKVVSKTLSETLVASSAMVPQVIAHTRRPGDIFTRSARERPRPGSPSRGASFTRSAPRPGSPRRTTSTSAPTSPVGSPRTAAVKAYELGEPVLSSWLDPIAPAVSNHGTTDKDLVQRHSEKCKQLRVAHAARNELELQIAQLHALGPQALWHQRVLIAEAAAAEAAAEAASLREEWSLRWQELRTLCQSGQLEALRRALDAPPSDGSATHPPPKPILGSTAVLPTAPATVDAVESRVRAAAPQPRASRATCPYLIRMHMRVRMPRARAACACPPCQCGVPPSMHPGCNLMHPGCSPIRPGCSPMHPGCSPMCPGCSPMRPGCSPMRRGCSPMRPTGGHRRGG